MLYIYTCTYVLYILFILSPCPHIFFIYFPVYLAFFLRKSLLHISCNQCYHHCYINVEKYCSLGKVLWLLLQPPGTNISTFHNTYSQHKSYRCSVVRSGTSLSDGHGSGFPNAAVGSCYHEGAAGHGHLQVLLHKLLGGCQECIPEKYYHLLHYIHTSSLMI